MMSGSFALEPILVMLRLQGLCPLDLFLYAFHLSHPDPHPDLCQPAIDASFPRADGVAPLAAVFVGDVGEGGDADAGGVLPDVAEVALDRESVVDRVGADAADQARLGGDGVRWRGRFPCCRRGRGLLDRNTSAIGWQG